MNLQGQIEKAIMDAAQTGACVALAQLRTDEAIERVEQVLQAMDDWYGVGFEEQARAVISRLLGEEERP